MKQRLYKLILLHGLLFFVFTHPKIILGMGGPCDYSDKIYIYKNNQLVTDRVIIWQGKNKDKTITQACVKGMCSCITTDYPIKIFDTNLTEIKNFNIDEEISQNIIDNSTFLLEVNPKSPTNYREQNGKYGSRIFKLDVTTKKISQTNKISLLLKRISTPAKYLICVLLPLTIIFAIKKHKTK
jgi:hypothetical protein